MEFKEQNKQTNLILKTDWELPERMGVGRLDKKGEGIKKYNWYLQNSPRDVKYILGNIGNNIVITMYGAR